MKDKINFLDLNLSLKIAIILAWIFGILNLITFVVGFFEGLLYY